MSPRPRRAVAVVFWLSLLSSVPGLSAPAWGDGCYVCGTGSRPPCGDYCRYAGKDSSEARRACEKKGCRVAGTSACPAPNADKRPPQVCSPDDAPATR